jgi:hypothetical protein
MFSEKSWYVDDGHTNTLGFIFLLRLVILLQPFLLATESPAESAA